jgi:5,10-methylenetetrahydromethanopterin reductase
MWQAGNHTIQVGVGLWLKYPYRRLVSLIEQAEDAGYDVLWCANEKFYRDMWVTLGLLSVHSKRARLGTFIAEPYTYHPAMIAAAMATIDEATNGRAILLLGAGGVGFAEMGVTRDKPLTALEEALTVIRRMLAGEVVSLDGVVIETHGARLDFSSRANLPIWIATRGNKTLQMTGRCADGVMIATYATPRGINAAMHQVKLGAQSRSVPREIAKTVRVDVALDDDPAAAHAAVKPMIAGMIKASYPNTDFIEQAGLEIAPELHKRLAQTAFSELGESADLIPESFVDAFAWAGTPEQIAHMIALVVDETGVEQLTFLPHSTSQSSTEHILERFANEVMPRVVAHLGG